jgi:hypothetical protein
MTKRKILWLAIIFVVYEVLVWAFSLLLLADSNSILIGSVLTICGLTLLGVYILVARLSARAAGPPAAAPAQAAPAQPSPPTPGTPATREETMRWGVDRGGQRADWHNRRAWPVSGPAAPSPISRLPDVRSGTGKTSLFWLPAWISGACRPGAAGSTVPTRLANIWFAELCVVRPAASSSPATGRWGRFLELSPRAPASLSKMFVAQGRSNVRAVVFCVDVSAFIGIPMWGRSAMGARAATICAGLPRCSARFPVYVVFRKRT